MWDLGATEVQILSFLNLKYQAQFSGAIPTDVLRLVIFLQVYFTQREIIKYTVTAGFDQIFGEGRE